MSDEISVNAESIEALSGWKVFDMNNYRILHYSINCFNSCGQMPD
jgi:hypothetical protein